MATEAEQKLLDELDKLEKSMIKKGDALADHPHDGGFANQGENIQKKAGVKKSLRKALKALIKGGMSKSEAKKTLNAIHKADAESESESESVEKAMDSCSSSSSVEKALDNDDDESSDGDESESESESDDMSSDDESIEKGGESSTMSSAKRKHEKFVKKSLGASQMQSASQKKPETVDIRKALSEEDAQAVDAVPVLSKLIDAINKSIRPARSNKELRKSLKAMRNTQTDFNGKIAKALTFINQGVMGLGERLAKIESQPVQQPARNTLKKGDIVEPAFHDGNTGGFDGREELSPLHSVPMIKIQETLVELVQKGQADLLEVTKFENSKGNLEVLPTDVLKRLEARLCS